MLGWSAEVWGLGLNAHWIGCVLGGMLWSGVHLLVERAVREWIAGVGGGMPGRMLESGVECCGLGWHA